MVTTAEHDWRLVAPWYRWVLEDGSEPERALHADRPALHKYATTDFAEDFLTDPQRSAVFDPKVDFAVPPEADTKAGVVKLFQPAHARYYVVAIELHCAVPGFPNVDPTGVAEAGFVLRRISPVSQEENDSIGRGLARKRVTSVADRRQSIGKDVLRRLHPFQSIDAKRVLDRGRAARAASAQSIVAARQIAVIDSKAITTKAVGEQGWVAAGEGTVGTWLPMDEEPVELVEPIYPLQALRADPDDPEHPARDGTIYFGLVPTASDEVTTTGKNRFDANDDYVIRAFVRIDEGDCPGRFVWSKPTHPFRVASFLDPVGSAQRPVEIAMPDLKALEESIALPSVRVSSPAGSSFRFKGGKDVPAAANGVGGAQVCFHSIPLITIVATFVLNIFMPVVIWLFQLWWMLRLKFCFPSPASASAVDTLLDPFGGIQGAFDVDLEDLGVLGAPEQADLKAALDAHFGNLYNDPIGTNDLNELVAILAAQGHGLPDDGLPNYTKDLTYTSAVKRDQVKEPWPP